MLRDEALSAAAAAGPSPSPSAAPPGYVLMFAGRRAGKTGVLRLLLDSLDVAACATVEQAHAAAHFASTAEQPTTDIRSVTLDVRAPAGPDGVVRLTLIDTPAVDFDAAPPAAAAADDDLCAHVDARYRRSLQDRIFDQHVHLCIYLLHPDDIIPATVRHAAYSPHAKRDLHADADRPSLHVQELQLISRLAARVNVLPVIARADTIMSDALQSIKKAVFKDLNREGLGFGIFDESNIAHRRTDRMGGGAPAHYRQHSSSLGSIDAPIPLLPYALVTPDAYVWGDGVQRRNTPGPAAAPGLLWDQLLRQYSPDSQARDKMAPGRLTRRYRWGTLDVLDPNHCDFVPFRDAIFGHMQALKTFTLEHLFGRWKSDNVPASAGDGKPMLSAHTHLSPQHLRHPSASLPFGLPPPSTAAAGAVPSAPGTLAPGGSGATSPPSFAQFIPGTSQYNLATGLPGVPKVRQKKILVACNFCRTRKLKCDGGRPACAQCIKRSNHCDYQPVLKRRGGFAGSGGKTKDECCDGDDHDAVSVLNGAAPSVATTATATSPRQPSTGGESGSIVLGVKRPLSPELSSEEDQPAIPRAHQHYTPPPRSARASFDERAHALPPIADMERDSRDRDRERPPVRMPVSHLVDGGAGPHGHGHGRAQQAHPQLPPIQIPQPTHQQHLPHSSLRTQDAGGVGVYEREQREREQRERERERDRERDRERERERGREREKMAFLERERAEWEMRERERERERERRVREWDHEREREMARQYAPPAPTDQFAQGHGLGHRRTASMPGPSPVVMHPHSRVLHPPPHVHHPHLQEQQPGPSPVRTHPPGQLPLPVPPPLRNAGPPSPKIHMDSAARADKVAMQLDKKKHGIRRSGSNYGPKTVACNFCRTRKTKCDGQHPKCGNCQKRSLACEYLEDQRRRGSHAKQQSADQDAAKAADPPSGSGDAQRLKKLAPAPSQQQQQQQHEAMSTASSSSSGRSPPSYVHHHAFEDSAAFGKRKGEELPGGPPLKKLRERSPPPPAPAPARSGLSLGELLDRRPLTPAAAW